MLLGGNPRPHGQPVRHAAPHPKPKPAPRPRVKVPRLRGKAAPVGATPAPKPGRVSIPHPGQPLSPYVNPFARSGTVTGNRIDQGVDYQGQPGAPIGALGPGKIVSALSSGSGWPGGGFIGEQLSAGPARGQVVYTAEDVAPTVKLGQKVKAGQPIGVFTSGGSIETGWGTLPPNVGQALAYGKQSAPGSDPGAYSTGFGIAFDRLVRALGGPAGKLQSTVSGTAPAAFSSPGGRVPGVARVSLPPAPAPVVIPSGVNPPASGGIPTPSIRLTAATTSARASKLAKPVGPPVVLPPGTTVPPFRTPPPTPGGVTTTTPPTFINSSVGQGGVTPVAAPAASGGGAGSTLLLVAGAGVVLVLILFARKKGK